MPISAYAGYLGFRGTKRYRTGTVREKSEGFYYGGSVGIEFIPDEHIGLRLTIGPNFRDLKAYSGNVAEYLVDWRMRFGSAYYLINWKSPPQTD